MAGFDQAFQSQLAEQSWTLYSVGMIIIALRMFARIRRVGFTGLELDDYLMLLAIVWYTTLVVTLNAIAQGGGSNLFLPGEFATLTEQQIEQRIQGSKVVVVSEQAMLNVIYTLKVCLIIMYGRLTIGTHQARGVKLVAVYVALCYVGTQLAFFLSCRPFSGYWSVPAQDPQCTTLQHYAIVQACFNLSSDVLLLLIPLPMIISLRLPTKQKAILGVVFSMGIFVIIAAILTKVYNLSNIWDTSYMLWYTREASVAVYVANLPAIWPLLREWMPFLRNSSSKPNHPYGQAEDDPGANPGLGPHTAGGATTKPNKPQTVDSRSSTIELSRIKSISHSASTSDDDVTTTGPPTPGLKPKHGFDFRLDRLMPLHGPSRSDGRGLMDSSSPWLRGDIRTEVTIEVEQEVRQSVDLEKGGRAVGWEETRTTREVTIQGGLGPILTEKGPADSRKP